jgi:hypothetical protein
MVDAFTEFGAAAYEVQNTIAVLRTGTASCIRFTCSACIFAESFVRKINSIILRSFALISTFCELAKELPRLQSKKPSQCRCSKIPMFQEDVTH